MRALQQPATHSVSFSPPALLLLLLLLLKDGCTYNYVTTTHYNPFV